MTSYCKQQAKEKILVDYYYKKYRLKPFPQLTKVMDKIDDIKYQLKNRFIFLTINPKPEFSENPEPFISAVKSIPNRKWCGNAIVAFEHRNVEHLQGLHAHLLCERRQMHSPSTIQHGLFKGIFRHFCMTKNHISYQLHSELDYHKTKKYALKSNWLAYEKKGKKYSCLFDNRQCPTTPTPEKTESITLQEELTDSSDETQWQKPNKLSESQIRPNGYSM